MRLRVLILKSTPYIVCALQPMITVKRKTAITDLTRIILSSHPRVNPTVALQRAIIGKDDSLRLPRHRIARNSTISEDRLLLLFCAQADSPEEICLLQVVDERIVEEFFWIGALRPRKFFFV